MSTSTSKRKSRKRRVKNTEVSGGDIAPEILGNGDNEIFSTLIPLMEDLDVLKTCRLVCKSWNEFACRALRKLPRNYYVIRESNLKTVDHRLELLEKNKNLSLPSPFGKFMVLPEAFREQSFLRLLKYVREDTNNNYSISLCINSNGVNSRELQTVLTTNPHNFKITELILVNQIMYQDPPYDFQAEKIRLPYLKSLIIGKDSYVNTAILSLCGNLGHFSPIKYLKIVIRSGEKLKKVMSPGGMKSVEKLCLKFIEGISAEDWKYLCARIMEISSLKKLEMHLFRLNFNECDLGLFETIVEHFSDTLEILTGDSLPMLKNKCYPKLRELNFMNFCKFNSEFAFPMERFPLLKRAHFLAYHVSGLDCPSVEEQSLGIEELSIRFHLCFSILDDVLKFISVAGMLFPNVSSFSIIHYGNVNFTSALFSVICKSFPKLTTLELRLEIRNPNTLSGEIVNVEDWLEKGWTLEQIPRDASLLDFPGLQKLTLGHCVSTTKHLFKYCLSKIPKLRDLTFYLNEDASAEDIRDSVGHLQRITVGILTRPMMSPDKQWVEEIERLRIMLPSVVEIRKGYEFSERSEPRYFPF